MKSLDQIIEENSREAELARQGQRARQELERDLRGFEAMTHAAAQAQLSLAHLGRLLCELLDEHARFDSKLRCGSWGREEALIVSRRGVEWLRITEGLSSYLTAKTLPLQLGVIQRTEHRLHLVMLAGRELRAFVEEPADFLPALIQQLKSSKP